MNRKARLFVVYYIEIGGISMKTESKSYLGLILHNAFRFVINVGFVFIFQIIFGVENILPGVAIGVGFTMLPMMDLPIRPWTMFFIIMLLYTGGGLAGELALVSPVLAFPLYFIFTVLIILLSNEPVAYKPNISFLLCFVFSQATPLPFDLLASRMNAVFFGGLIVGVGTLINWYRYGYGKNGRTMRQQIQLCAKNRSYIFRMSFGIAFAMTTGMLLHLQKPLWISIVVMSLTQLEFSETMERIKYRFIGTMIGVVLFFLLFQILIPQQYAMYVVMFFGYIGFFLPDYKYKQIINAVSALNASLVLLDGVTAIEQRIACLVAGIVIVIVIYALTFVMKKLKKLQQDIQHYVLADDFPYTTSKKG